jgi:hypothetical protein
LFFGGAPFDGEVIFALAAAVFWFLSAAVLTSEDGCLLGSDARDGSILSRGQILRFDEHDCRGSKWIVSAVRGLKLFVPET